MAPLLHNAQGQSSNRPVELGRCCIARIPSETGCGECRGILSKAPWLSQTHVARRDFGPFLPAAWRRRYSDCRRSCGPSREPARHRASGPQVAASSATGCRIRSARLRQASTQSEKPSLSSGAWRLWRPKAGELHQLRLFFSTVQPDRDLGVGCPRLIAQFDCTSVRLFGLRILAQACQAVAKIAIQRRRPVARSLRSSLPTKSAYRKLS